MRQRRQNTQKFPLSLQKPTLFSADFVLFPTTIHSQPLPQTSHIPDFFLPLCFRYRLSLDIYMTFLKSPTLFPTRKNGYLLSKKQI